MYISAFSPNVRFCVIKKAHCRTLWKGLCAVPIHPPASPKTDIPNKKSRVTQVCFTMACVWFCLLIQLREPPHVVESIINYLLRHFWSCKPMTFS